ncbi:MAG: hypothetical protein L6435_15280 [Anaerolineae bacterium]|nr:hypothetical protein [Anaerolineae bacterium]
MAEEQWVAISEELRLYGTPEAQALFDDWARRMEQAVLACVREQGLTKPQEIAAHLKISSDSVLFLLDRLTRGEHGSRADRH